MKGQLVIAGLGPGLESWITPAAREAVEAADIILGYTPYVNRITARPGQVLETSDNREELARAERALALAAGGKRVVIVSGGDPGVFAMAAAVYEAVEANASSADGVDIRVEPGITAMLAAAARIGAPLGHDFCAISLSDNLKPWSTIEKRLRLAAEADFVIALYNPASKARPQRIKQAFEILSAVLPAETIVVFARAVGRADEEIDVVTLALAPSLPCDMRTLVIVGSRATRQVKSSDGRAWVYTPRSERG